MIIKRYQTLLITFCLGVSLFSVSISAAVGGTFYIDYLNGNDYNDGTSILTPWKHCPGDINAIGNPATKTFTGGDAVIFKGGVSYAGEILVHSGTSTDRRVVYDGNTTGAWGSGQAIIDGNAQFYHAFNAKQVSHVTIRGFEIINVKNTYNSSSLINGSAQNGYAKVYRSGQCQSAKYNGSNSIYDMGAIRLYRQCDDIIIEENKIHGSENWDDGCCVGAESDGDSSTIAPNGIASQIGIEVYDGNTNITIQNNEVYAAGKFAIRVWRGSNIKILNNDIGGKDSGEQEGHFSVAFSITGGVGGVTMSGNTVHDGWQLQGDENYGRCHSGNWFHIYGNNNNLLDEKDDPHDIVIEKNFIYSDREFQCANGSGLGQFEDDTYNITVRNNIVVNPFGRGFSVPEASNVQFLGNTFIFYDTSGTGCNVVGTTALYFGSQLDTAYIRHTIKDNIFVQMNKNSAVSAIYYDNSITPSMMPIVDNNLYYRTNVESSVIRYGTANFTLAEWQKYASTNFDNQDAKSRSGDPKFLNLPVSGANVSSGNYRLTKDSTDAIMKGEPNNLLIEDFVRTLRPLQSPIDIGAYQYSGITGGLSRPSDFKVVQ
ncbi:hypothetical protein FCL47_15215 [Desulfopila sp. IMCC35006]|uniref:right-handed parallel beta-helix repeat-containing protein n=1 Tax=Desulfopila sp. IMCC35006 TaxID=2569542 RepID=UPI0010ACF4BD|nr:right-handed parallel beta-helix repeat-containing protein [Desulfopila sp. IMCC35006]TKB24998.1 hypothetical protein FCL47_15215 [Desulfopila sp. IMCC35006]